MKTNNMSREYKIDYINEKIIVTKKFLKAAGVYNSPEYKLMKELRAELSTFQFEEKKIEKKAGKVTHKNLTFEKMSEHLILRFGKDSETVKRYDYLLEFYKTHTGRYCNSCYSTFGTYVNIMKAHDSEAEILKACDEAITAIHHANIEPKETIINDIHGLQQLRLVELGLSQESIQEQEKLLEEKKKEEEARAAEQAYIDKHFDKLSAGFLSTTGYDFSGYEITEYLGVISDGVVQGTGFLSELSADFNDFFGTESNTFATKMRLCRESALGKIKSIAIRKGANALIGIDFDTMTFRNNMIGIMATGTAVKIEKIDKPTP